MRKVQTKNAFLILAALVLAPMPGFSQPVSILLLDAPLAYEEMSPFLRTDMLRSFQMTSAFENRRSIWEINQAEYTRLRAQVSPSQQEEAIDDLEAFEWLAHDQETLDSSSPTSPARAALLNRLRARPLQNPEYVRRLKIVGTLLHATAVAQVIVADADPAMIQILHVPIVDSPERRAPHFSEIFRGHVHAYQSTFRQQLDEISDLIDRTNTRVVNGSFGADVASVKAKILRNVSPLMKTLFRKQIHRFAEALAEMQVLEFQQFIRRHPNVIFVLSAGNFRESTSRQKGSFARVEGENLVLVAATNFQGELAGFSSYSNKDIEIAAPGVLIPTPTNRGARVIRLSGTSMAAPFVTRRIAELMVKRPRASVREVIDHLFDSETIELEALASKIQRGRFLLPPFLVQRPRAEVQSALSNLDEASYLIDRPCLRALQQAR